MKKQICELLDISDVSYYRWKKDRLIITFLEKYFTEDEITEYIQIKKIEKLELIKNYSTLDLKELMRETLYINKKNKTEILIEKLLDFYKVDNVSELAFKMGITQSTISNWRNRNTINPIETRCRELGIFKEIFEYQGMNEKKENDLSEYFKALKSIAIATNKENELSNDIKELIKKYMQ